MSLISITVTGDFNNIYKKLRKLDLKLDAITIKLNKIMATQEEITAVLTRINDATDNIAQDLRDLRDQIANGGLTGEQEANVLAQLDAAATKLEGIAADPENPTPENPENPPVDPANPTARRR